MTLSLKAMVTKVRQLANEHPENVTGCNYYLSPHSPEPCCIMGWAFTDLGITQEQLRKAHMDRHHHLCHDELGIYEVLRELGASVYLQGGLSRWLTLVQSAQDDGYTWGDAVKYADERAVMEAEAWND